MTSSVWLALLISLVSGLAAMTIAALVSHRLKKIAVIDVTWGLGASLIAVVAASTGEGSTARRWIIAALVCLWGVRLAWHIHRRASKQHGGAEDPRYLDYLGIEAGDPIPWALAIRKIFLVQALALWLITLPIAVGSVTSAELSWLVWVGVVVAGLGLVYEAIGDAQLAAYQRQPRGQRPTVLSTGLWAWSRHPNYFGEAVVWWGLWVAAALSTGWIPALATVIAPIAMTYFVAFATGARLLERTMMQRRGYREYADVTPMMIPRPPRRK